MGGAVDMCSGLGACRKTLDGTMCPSYMATREEAHSTRGRANVLRLAMAGRLGERASATRRCREVLDLCLECRACKAECPVGVDVARFKSEFLADYWARHGTPLRARALGHVHELARWGSRLAPLSNWVARSAPARWLNERVLGLDRRRKPPRWASDDLRAAVRTPSGVHRRRAVRRSVQRHVHELLPPRGRPGRPRRCSKRSGVRVGARAQRLLRPAAHLPGPARRGAERAAANAELLYPLAVARRAAPVPRAELPVGGARRRAGSAAAARPARRRRRWRRRACSSRTGSSAPTRPGRRRSASARGRPARSCSTATAIRRRWGSSRRRRRCCRASPAPRSSTSMPAAAAWRARSATRASTTRCRARSASGVCCPPRAALDSASVLVASGVSCRHQVEDFTGTRPLHPAELLVRCSRSLMSLAALSVLRARPGRRASAASRD